MESDMSDFGIWSRSQCSAKYGVTTSDRRPHSRTPISESNMNSDELRRRLRHAADLLEAFASDARPNEALRDSTSGQSESGYVDMASGQVGVSGGVRQVDVGAQMKRRDYVVREVA